MLMKVFAFQLFYIINQNHNKELYLTLQIRQSYQKIFLKDKKKY